MPARVGDCRGHPDQAQAPATLTLAEVRGELDELTAPLPNRPLDADIHALTATLAGRAALARALELVIPALERQTLEELRADIDAVSRSRAKHATVQRRISTRSASAATLRKPSSRRPTVPRPRPYRVNAVLGEGYKLDDEVRAHEVHYGATTPSE